MRRSELKFLIDTFFLGHPVELNSCLKIFLRGKGNQIFHPGALATATVTYLTLQITARYKMVNHLTHQIEFLNYVLVLTS